MLQDDLQSLQSIWECNLPNKASMAHYGSAQNLQTKLQPSIVHSNLECYNGEPQCKSGEPLPKEIDALFIGLSG